MSSRACTVLVVSCLAAAHAAEKPRLAVLELTVKGIEASAGPLLTEWLQGALAGTGAFNVVERGQVNKILDEADFQKSDCTESACAVKAGRILNVRKVVIGTVGKFGQAYLATIRLVDVETGEVERQARQMHKGDMTDLPITLDALAGQLASGSARPVTVPRSPPVRTGKSYLAAMAEARRFIGEGVFDKAMRAADEALAAKPGDPVASGLRRQALERQLSQRIDAAHRAVAAGRLEQAESLAQEVLAVRSGHLGALRVLERAAASRLVAALEAEKQKHGSQKSSLRQDLARWSLSCAAKRRSVEFLSAALARAKRDGLSDESRSEALAEAKLVVRFESEPAGAELFVEGTASVIGRTPCEWTFDGRPVLAYQILWPQYPPVLGELSLTQLVRQDWKVDATRGSREMSVSLPGGVKLDLVWIPAGEFLMGTPAHEKDRGSDEGPQHRVQITKGFWMGKYEVTQEQWKAVMGTTPWEGETYAKGNPRHAVSYVSWNDCQDFVKKLNSRASGGGFRLPTEAEWEYACRAGTTTRFYYGDDPDYAKLGDYAWYTKNAWDAGGRHAHEVGQKKPNAWGLYDMHGNVWEWCEDWYGEDWYDKSATEGPKGPSSGSYRVLRGGSWNYFPSYCRAANRDWHDPSLRNFYVDGFRIVCCPRGSR